MKKILFALALLSILLTACAATAKPQPPAFEPKTLIVTEACQQITFTGAGCAWANTDQRLYCYAKMTYVWDSFWGEWREYFDSESVIYVGNASSWRIDTENK